MNMDKVLLEVDKLSIWYETKKYIVKDSKLSISENEIIALVGVNGAGKTTLINTLDRIHSKYNLGEFIFRNEKLEFDDESFKMNRIAVFSQDESFRYWNFVEYMKFIFETYNIPLDSKYIDYLIDGFSFRKYINYMKKDLSMGNKKKFSLIVAFGLRLPFLILDEPTAGLDPKERVRFRNLISTLSENRIVILSTHIVSDVEYIAKEILIMKNGELLRQGSPETILQSIHSFVWECDVPRQEIERLEKNYIVANLKHSAEAERLRIISEVSPYTTAWNVEPTLEDLYLYYFAEVSDNE